MIQIILIRHGESLEDINNNIYAEIADNDIPLTDKGVSQVIGSAQEMRKIITFKKVRICHGTAKRVVQSAKLLARELKSDFRTSLIRSVLLKKQDWGSVTYLDRKNYEPERYKAGVLNYSYPNGESGREVESRTKLFIEKFIENNMSIKDPVTFIIVTHGFNFRLFLKLILGLTDEIFAKLANPRQCHISSIIHDGRSYVLSTGLDYYDKSKNIGHVDKV